LDIGPSNRHVRLTYIASSFSYVRPLGRPQFVAKLRTDGGRKLPAPVRLKNKVLQLFYGVPRYLRENKVPHWFPVEVNIPKYLFRIGGEKLSVKQKVISTLCRLYLMWRYRLGRGLNRTSWLIRASRDDILYHLLRVCHTRNWYTACSIVYRRLKVLLCPLTGP
jgi:hypothetical protein